MRVEDEIRGRLEDTFQPDTLSVVDDSEAHRGHAGFREGGQTHFIVAIQSPRFAPMSRIARHRAIHEALGPELIARIHALELKIST